MADQLSFKATKNWILGGRSLEFQATLLLSPGGLSDLIDGCMRTVTPLLAPTLNGGELLDFKGRNPQDCLLPGLAVPRNDELFRVGGMCAVEQRGREFEWEPFEVSCYSPFQRFEGTHHIIHGIEMERIGSIPPWLPARLLGCAAPIEPRFFRYGLEHFTSILTFASLGYAPQVTESLLLDCTTNSVSVKLVIEARRGREENPFNHLPAYRAIAQAVERATGKRIDEIFADELTRA
jgi:hypothetical protein